MGCPRCNCTNNWLQCSSCGGVICNSCGFSQAGQSRAANACPYCGATGRLTRSGPPSWGR